MSGIVDLKTLLKQMSPEIQEGEYVFCTLSGSYADYEDLQPLASFVEPEGLTLILPLSAAKQANLPHENRFKQITLTVHSSLDAVGLTAAVSNQLTRYGISANVVAAYHHDHIFVPAAQADKALEALLKLGEIEVP
ncbi:MAG: ACT domain-containing protein [Desulfobulbaceae bacterium]|nr:MAG: ACT domain-containing protein [Desulfobulbaceae bacterium]